jgi:AraC-like DNA-binding protein
VTAAAQRAYHRDVTPDASTHRFLRDPRLPFVEVRDATDARAVAYGRHSHDTVSVGLVTGGRSTYVHERGADDVEAGAVVLMNPGAMHACNPLPGSAWSYSMAYIDAGWWQRLQCDIDADRAGALREFDATSLRDPALGARVTRVCESLADPHAGALARHEAVVELAMALHARTAPSRRERGSPGLARVAELLTQCCDQAFSLAQLCAVAGLSEAHLVRSFKRAYGLTPHAWLLDRRIQRSRHELRRGRPIADVAAQFGFADQAHLQRTFRRLVATTPGHYRGVTAAA